MTPEKYILDFLRKVHPAHRTIKELHWWFVTMDKIGSHEQLKCALQTLKKMHLIRYEDPIGWVATGFTTAG